MIFEKFTWKELGVIFNMGFFNYLKLSKDPEVYSPQEDTFFLTDVLVQKFQNKEFPTSRLLLVCEVGIGSGFISIILGTKFPQIRIIGVDICPKAVSLCHKNMSEWLQPNQFEVVCTNLLRGFNPLLFHPVIVYFNPPYVPSSKEEFNKGSLHKSWAGGTGGVTLIQDFLETLTEFSFKKAFFLSSIHNTNEVFETHFQDFFEFQVIAERKIDDDRLLCYEVIRLT